MAGPAPEARPVEPSSWLPDFCVPGTALAVLALAETVLIVVLSAPGQHAPTFTELTTGTLLVQWLACAALVALCSARDQLARLPVVASVASAYAIVLAVVGLASWVAIALDRLLALGFTRELGEPVRAVASIVAITLLVTTAALRYFYVRAQWQHGVKAQARAQVQALQARIRPHFLFNSMNTIASLIATRPEAAERAVEDLSELFRAALSAGDELSDLGRELELIDSYLAIEQWRLGPRLTVTRALDELPRDLPIPALSLQPLVENAVLHGIEALSAGGVIAMACEVRPERVVFSIRNPRAAGRPVRPHGNHIALDNIRQRLKYHFGERAALEVDAGPDYYACRVTLPRG